MLVPGYRATAEQPILVSLAAALDAVGVRSHRIAFSTSRGRPSRAYEIELAELRAARDAARASAGGGPVALVGRSFGGRMCALLASAEPPDAVAIIGHPIAPPGRPRPRDEAALAEIRCPTLVVQGELDPLGPLPLLERIAGGNPRVDLVRIAGAGHELGAAQDEAVAAVARWLDAVLR